MNMGSSQSLGQLTLYANLKVMSLRSAKQFSTGYFCTTLWTRLGVSSTAGDSY